MTVLTWETLLLLAVAYLAGCCIGCIARRRAGRRRAEQPAVQPNEHQPVQEPVASLPQQRLIPPLAPLRAANPQAAAKSAPNLVREPFRRADAPAGAKADPIIEPGDPVEQSAKAVARFERALSGEEAAPTSISPVVEGKAIQRPAATAPGRPPSGDDLKRIRGIDQSLEQRLHALGVTAFAAIAQWTAADVARISHGLGFKGRIQHENWIEQALILSKGADTLYARRIARGEAAGARAIEDEGEPRSLHEMRPKPRPSDGVPAVSRAVTSEPARETAAPSARIAESAAPQVERHSSPDVSGRAAFADKPSLPAADTAHEPTAEARSLPVMEDAGAGQALPAIGAVRDNFQRIRGINAEIERLLLEQGARRYAQIASWGKADTERLDRLLGQEGRVARENWIEQAQILAKGGDTAYSRDYDRRTGVEQSGATSAQSPKLAEAIREHLETTGESKPQRTSDVSSLRSVKSEALRTADAAQGPAASKGRIGRSATADDLKRIRGVGVLIEKKLHAAGVTAYEHIANWTAADIERVSRLLDFKGQIERENWVEQARILASGGQTEFSRRVDRGEVVTSRIRQP